MIHMYTKGRWPRESEVTDYAYNCLMHFFRKEPTRDITFELEMVPKMKGALGYCYGDKNHVIVELSRREKVDDGTWELVPFNEMMQNLAHEIVHAKQFLKGELNERDNSFTYRGVKKVYDTESYRECPWEHQAFMFESFLYKLYWENRTKIELHRRFIV